PRQDLTDAKSRDDKAAVKAACRTDQRGIHSVSARRLCFGLVAGESRGTAGARIHGVSPLGCGLGGQCTQSRVGGTLMSHCTNSARRVAAAGTVNSKLII